MIAEIPEILPNLQIAKPVLTPYEVPGDTFRILHPQKELPDPLIQWVGGQLFRLVEDDCVIPDFRHRRHHIVKEGFEFDAASVPRLAWMLIAPIDLGVLAVLSHDDLYHRGGRAKGQWRYTRSEADALFYDLMTLEGVGTLRRRAAYQAVRRFGSKAWQG